MGYQKEVFLRDKTMVGVGTEIRLSVICFLLLKATLMQAKDSCKQNYCLAESCFSKAFSFNLDGAYGLCSVAWIILLQEPLSILHDFYSEYKSLNSLNKTKTW